MEKEIVSISKGNSKLGAKISNISLTPVLSCVSGVPCAKKECYALKSYRQYPNVRNAWDKNLRIFLSDPATYFEQINVHLQSKTSLFFRWHVGGDIPNIRYLLGMVELSAKNPQTQFLAFTKNYGILANFDKPDLPKNLSVVVSAWPKYSIPKYIRDQGYKIAWYDDGTETRYSKKFSTVCSGKCDDCLECWDSKSSRMKRDVILPSH